MRRSMLVAVIVLGITQSDLLAQRYLPGMRGLQCVVGTVNGVDLQKGFHAGVAFSSYTKRADRWVFGIEYLEKRHPYKET